MLAKLFKERRINCVLGNDRSSRALLLNDYDTGSAALRFKLRVGLGQFSARFDDALDPANLPSQRFDTVAFNRLTFANHSVFICIRETAHLFDEILRLTPPVDRPLVNAYGLSYFAVRQLALH